MNMNKKTRMPKMESEMRPEGMGMPRFGARAMRPGGMKKGGMAHADAAMDKKLIRKEIARAEKMEEKSEGKGMKKGGAVKKMMGGGNPGMPSQRLMQQQAAPRPGMGRPGPITQQQVGMGRPSGSMNLGTAAGPGGGRPAPITQQQVGMGLIGRPGMAMKKGGAVGKMAKGGGVERKGKTKGKFI